MKIYGAFTILETVEVPADATTEEIENEFYSVLKDRISSHVDVTDMVDDFEWEYAREESYE